MEGVTPPRALNAGDDREAFDCGRESVNQWFRRHAWRNQQSGASRTNVVCDAGSGTVAGCVALSAATIERAFLPRPAQRDRPDRLPAVLLGQLGVDRRWHGRGVGRSLLWFAFGISVRFSKEVGCFGVLTHPLDDGVRVFYRRFGFEDLPFDPGRAMIVRIADLERNGFGVA